MMYLKASAPDLVKWGRYFQEMPEVTMGAATNAMNVFGAGTQQAYAQHIAQKYGLDPDDVMRRIVVKEATADDPVWEMDARAAIPPDADWNRDQTWQGRDTSDFEQNTLVNVITMADGFDCPVCQQVAEEGPYAMSDIMTMQAKWAGYEPPTPNIHPGTITNLVHPRCRCTIQTWQSSRRMPVAFGGSAGAPQELLTMKGLAKAFGDELRVRMRVLKGRLR